MVDGQAAPVAANGSAHRRVGEVDIPALVVTEDEAAKLLRVSVRTLGRLRVDGDGPRFVRLTGRRIGYAVADLEAWIRARAVGSTSEATESSRRPSAGVGGRR